MTSFTNQCVICCKLHNKTYNNYADDSSLLSLLGTHFNGSKLLTDHLYVYFITRKLLKLTEEQCLQTLTSLSNEYYEYNDDDNNGTPVPTVASSFPLCPVCKSIVSKAVNFHRHILALHEEIDKLGSSLLDKLTEESNQTRIDNDDGGTGERRIKTFRRIRNCLISGGIPPNPLLVKRELEELPHNEEVKEYDNFFEDDLAGDDDDDNDDNDSFWNEVKNGRSLNTTVNPASGAEDSRRDSDSDYEPETERRVKRSRLSNNRRKNRRFQTNSEAAENVNNDDVEKSVSNYIPCERCDSTFTTIPGYKKHLKVHEQSDLLKHQFDCRICRHPTISESKLRRHMTKIHSRNKDNNLKPTALTKRKRRKRKFGQQSKFNCTRCKSVYTTLPGYYKHLRYHKKSDLLMNEFDCSICGHPTTSESNLSRHITTIHKEKSANTISETASESFNSITSGTTDNNKTSHDNSESLNTSLERQTDKRYSCKRCKSTFNSRAGVLKHKRMHQSSDLLGNIFDCPICGFPATSKKKLSRHTNMMHNENESSKETVSPLVNTSLQEESGERYTCNVCDSTYGSRAGIWNHRRAHQESNLLGNKYDCTICGHPNTTETKLRRHMNNIHSEMAENGNRKVEDQDNYAEAPELDTNFTTERPKRACVVKRENTDREENLLSDNDNDGNDEDWSPISGEEDFVSQVDQSLDEDSDSDLGFENSKQKRSSITDNNTDVLLHCDKCNVSYKSQRGFQTHQEEHKASIDLNHKFDCKQCGFPNSSERRLRLHERRVHQKIPMYTCSLCSFQVPTQKRLRKHMRKHTRTSSYQYRKQRKSKWSNYINSKGEFECNTCQVGFEDADKLRIHMSEHEKSKLLGGVYDCDICKYPCSTETRLRIHKHVKHGKSIRPTCEICNISFPQSSLLKNHLQMHSKHDKLIDPETGKYRCDLCSFDGTLKEISLHKNNCHKGVVDPDQKAYICPQCGLSLSTPCSLKQHIRNKHENFYRFTCEICGRGLKERESFIMHMKTHEENRSRDYICSSCGVSYLHQKTLNEHINRFHPEISTSRVIKERKTEKEGRYTCKFCKIVFPYKYLLVNHIPSVHQDLYTFKCDVCDKSYISGSSLKLHKEIAHATGSLKYVCHYCGKTFPHKHYVVCHYKWCKLKKEGGKPKYSETVVTSEATTVADQNEK